MFEYWIICEKDKYTWYKSVKDFPKFQHRFFAKTSEFFKYPRGGLTLIGRWNKEGYNTDQQWLNVIGRNLALAMTESVADLLQDPERMKQLLITFPPSGLCYFNIQVEQEVDLEPVKDYFEAILKAVGKSDVKFSIKGKDYVPKPQEGIVEDTFKVPEPILNNNGKREIEE